MIHVSPLQIHGTSCYWRRLFRRSERKQSHWLRRRSLDRWEARHAKT